MKKWIQQLTASKYLFHYLLWATLILQLSMDNAELAQKDGVRYVLNLVSRNVLLMGIVYANLFVFIPKLLKQKRYGLYVLSILTVTIVYILISTTILDYYMWRSGKEDMPRFNWNMATIYFFTAMRYLIISFLFNYIQERHAQEQKMAAIQLEKMRSDLNYLRAQINPHFLFNTFNNLYSLALDKSEKTPEIILKLSDMMDYMLYESNETEVALEKDVENLQNYIEIERIRQGNNAKIHFYTEGVLLGRKIAPLLFLPLVENAFKHGVNKSIENAFLEGCLSVNDTTILFELKNNIPKNSSKNGHLSHGIGLENLKKRLELTYPNRYLLETHVENDIFYTTLKINQNG
jgi:two-component system, LytTR family, sensor kinase